MHLPLLYTYMESSHFTLQQCLIIINNNLPKIQNILVKTYCEYKKQYNSKLMLLSGTWEIAQFLSTCRFVETQVQFSILTLGGWQWPITLDLRSLIAFSGYLGVLCTHMYTYTHVYNLKSKINLKIMFFKH